MMADEFSIRLPGGESVTALLYPAQPGEPRRTLVLGHGAGANQRSDFMVLFAQGLSARGIEVVTFNFLYMEKGRRYPDRPELLEECYREAIRATRGRVQPGGRLFVGGKSLGGRIASQAVASGSEDRNGIAGLVFLGYPLHPPGKPEKQRSKRLFEIQAPMLFCQGSRDAFGTPDEIREISEKLPAKTTLYIVDGGDHSFTVPKRLQLSQEKVFESVMDEIERWSRKV